MIPEPTDDIWEALYTTRAMRRMHPDPLSRDVQMRIVDSAMRAPRGGNRQRWRLLLVDDRSTMAGLGELYRAATAEMWQGPYDDEIAHARDFPDSERARAFGRLRSSVQYLADNFDTTPLLMLALSRNDPGGASVMPAVWSAMLAARAQGVGSVITSVLENYRRPETFELLGIPSDRGWEVAATVAMGYPRGRWGVAPREGAHETVFRDRWGADPGFTIDAPLWNGS